MEPRIELGVVAKDQITGFEGVVTGYAKYVTGCEQWLLEQPVDEDGKKRDNKWFDEERLVVTAPKVILQEAKVKPSVDRPTGGPQQDAPRR